MRIAPLAIAVVAWLAVVPAWAVEVTFWHSLSGSDGQTVEAMAQAFNAAHPGVTIKPQFVGDYGDTVTKLQAAIPAGRQPDLVMLEITRYGLFAERGALEALDPYFAKAPEVRQRLLPFALDAASYHGKLFVLPFNVSTPLMYFNRDLFRKAGLDPAVPPRSWAELEAAAEKLTLHEGNRTVQWGINPPPQWVRWALANQLGGGWIDPATDTVLIDRPESIAAYGLLADFVNKSKIGSADAAIKEAVAKQYFLAGTTAVTFDSSGSLADLRNTVKFDLGVAPIPCAARCAAPIGGATIGVLAAAPAERKEAAWAFLDYITQPAQNALFFANTGYLPIVAGAAEESVAKAAIAKEPAYGLAIAQLAVAFARARPPAMPAIRSKEETVWQTIVLQQTTADKALGDFANEMRAQIAAK
jgi:sn-glycerol 3-phosphate transport system substrate-binding protein